MEKLVDRIAEWLPLGMGEARRNFISGVISITVTWPFIASSNRKPEYSYVDSIKWFMSLIDEHILAIFFLGLVIIFIGRIVDFFGGLFPMIYNFLINVDSRVPSELAVFRILLYRCFRRKRKFDFGSIWKDSLIMAEKLDQITRKRNKNHQEKRFKSDLTLHASEQFDKLPDIAKDGLANPFSWNFDISINFIMSQSKQKEYFWILQRENRRKFIYMVLCSVFLPVIILLFASLMISIADIMINLEEIITKFSNIMENGLKNSSRNKTKEISRLSEIDQPIFVVFACIALFCFLFIFYVQYVKSCCLLYAEVFALSRYVQQDETSNDSPSCGFVEDHIPQIGAQQMIR